MTDMNNLLSGKKKLITMILGIVSGLAIAFGLDQTEISAIAGAVVAVGSVISYMVAEGRIDVERIKTAADAVNDAIDIMEGVDASEPLPKTVLGFTDATEGDESDEQAESN
jgi:phage shock protein PspC (stress-responsive transcriptional regulator)